MHALAVAGGPSTFRLALWNGVWTRVAVVTLLSLGAASGAHAQAKLTDDPSAQSFAEPLPAGGVRLDKALTQRWRVGVVITAAGQCTGVLGTVPIPTDWPEQQVKVIERDVTEQVKRVQFRTLDNGVRQMLVEIASLRPGETARAVLTFEVTRHSLLPPEDSSIFRLPQKMSPDVRRYLAPSPFIESRHTKITSLAREIVGAEPNAWRQVELLYDWVREHVEYKNGELKGALAALKDGDGDCEELTSLFIALCRARQIPARTVWIPDHCYPEFYLEDQEGQGHWIPCQAAGTRDFGGMPEFRPVLQKGDNFKVPEKREPQRYVAEFLSVKAVRGAGQPKVEFLRELIAGE